MTIIFITIYPFNEDYANKYGFDVLRRRGLRVVILNVSRFLFPTVHEPAAKNDVLESVSGVAQQRIETGAELETALGAIPGNRIAILVVHPHIRLLRCLRRVDVEYAEIYLNTAPTGFGPDKTLLERVARSAKALCKRPGQFFSQMFVRLTLIMPYALMQVRPPKFLIIGANVTMRRAMSKKTKPIYTHSFDYDKYLRNKNASKAALIPDYEYYVHLSCHPWGVHDYLLMNLTPAITKQAYAEKINQFFDALEAETGKKVIISAHPKASENEDIYRGRPFLKTDTEQLVKYSAGVTCHYSGAVNFALIHDKPICITSMRELDDDPFFQYAIQNLSASLRAKIRYIDTDQEIRELFSEGIFFHDAELYGACRRKYLMTSGSDGRLIWEKVADVLLREESV